MKKFFLGAIVAACSIMPAKAGRIVTDSIQSKVLSATVKYNIYLPDGFNKSEDKYPVVYLLHGFTDYTTICRLLEMWKTCLKSNQQTIPDHWKLKDFIKQFVRFLHNQQIMNAPSAGYEINGI